MSEEKRFKTKRKAPRNKTARNRSHRRPASPLGWAKTSIPLPDMIALRHFAYCLLLLALPCAAAQWKQVSSSSESGATVSLDVKSVSASQYITTGWVRVDYQSPREREGMRMTGYVAQWQANCENQTYWVTNWYGYPAVGAEPVQLYITSQQWLTPVPGSAEAVALPALCEETKSLLTKVIEKVGEFRRKLITGN